MLVRAVNRATGSFDQTQKIVTKDKSLIAPRQPQCADLGQFYSRMQPWSVGAKQNLCTSGALNGLFQDVESANARGVGVDIWMPNEMIDQRDLRLPVIREAA